MTTPKIAPDRRLIVTSSITGLLFAWLAFLIFDARDQLDHYGDDPTAIGALAGWLALITGAGYAVLAVLTGLRAGRRRVIALAIMAPAALCGLYAFTLGATNTDKVGFSAGSLILYALGAMILGLVASLRIVADARE